MCNLISVYHTISAEFNTLKSSVAGLGWLAVGLVDLQNVSTYYSSCDADIPIVLQW